MDTHVAIQCAKLQHVVNYRVIPDCARIELNSVTTQNEASSIVSSDWKKGRRGH